MDQTRFNLQRIRAIDWNRDPDPNHWRTINGSHVHLDKNGNYDGGAGNKFNRWHHYGPDWKQKASLMQSLTNALRSGMAGKQKNVAPQGTSTSGKIKVEITESSFPPAYTQRKEKKNIKEIVSQIAKLKSADLKAKTLYSRIGNMAAKTGVGITVSHHGSDGCVSHWIGRNKFDIKFPIIRKSGMTENEVRENMATWFHENMHAIDYMLRDSNDEWTSRTNQALTQARDKATAQLLKNGLPQSAKEFIEYHKHRKAQIEVRVRAYSDEVNKKCTERLNAAFAGKILMAQAMAENWKDLDKVKAHDKMEYDKLKNGEFALFGNYTDLYDALMGGSLYAGSGGYLSYRVAGHGIKYYSRTEKRSSEMLANWGALKMMAPGLAKRFSQECPEVAKALDGVLDELMTKSKA